MGVKIQQAGIMLLLLVFSILPMITICYEDYDYDYNYDDYDYDYSDYYDYYFASPWFLDYNICEGDFCMEKTMWVDSDMQTKVPNTELVLHNEHYYQVGTEGLMTECAPGLEIKDLAEYVTSCYDIEGGFDTWTYIEACEYSKLGWLQQNTSINVGKLDSISGISDKVKQCISPEKKKGKLTRTAKRGGPLKDQKTGKRSPNKKKGKGFRSRKASNKGGKARRRNNRKRKPRGASRETEGQRRRMRSMRKNGDKTDKKEKKEKKKKKREEKKILKSIQLDSVPSEETLDQLQCVRHAVSRGLEDCAGKLISENIKIPPKPDDTGAYTWY